MKWAAMPLTNQQLKLTIMNKEFEKQLRNVVFSTDQDGYAELFDIYSRNCQEMGYDDEQYVFNILNKRQAAKAVAMFGFEAVANAVKDDWIIFAKRDEASGEWTFTSKSPRQALDDIFDSLIADILCSNRYPEWITEKVGRYVASFVRLS